MSGLRLHMLNVEDVEEVTLACDRGRKQSSGHEGRREGRGGSRPGSENQQLFLSFLRAEGRAEGDDLL